MTFVWASTSVTVLAVEVTSACYARLPHHVMESARQLYLNAVATHMSQGVTNSHPHEIPY